MLKYPRFENDVHFKNKSNSKLSLTCTSFPHILLNGGNKLLHTYLAYQKLFITYLYIRYIHEYS